MSYLLDRLEHEAYGSKERVESPSSRGPAKGNPEEIPSGRKKSRTVEEGVERVPIIAKPNHIHKRHADNVNENSSYDYGNGNSASNAFSTSTSIDNGLSDSGEMHPIARVRQKCYTGEDSPGKTTMRNSDANMRRHKSDIEFKNIFKSLEEYIITSFKSRECVNSSFTPTKNGTTIRTASEDMRRKTAATTDERQCRTSATLSTMDAKTPMTVGFPKNGSWSSGREHGKASTCARPCRTTSLAESSSHGVDIVNPKSPLIDWVELNNWYRIVLHAGTNWERHLDNLLELDQSGLLCSLSAEDMQEVEKEMSDARIHTRRVLLKATESLLKRPGGLLREPDDIRFLLIILENPLLHPSRIQEILTPCQNSESRSGEGRFSKTATSLGSPQIHNSGPGQHSGIIKRVFGLLSNLPNECHHYLVGWFARFSESHFRKTIDLVGGFVTYRLTRQQGREHLITHDHIAELIPRVSVSGRDMSAALHTVLGASNQSTKKLDDRSISVAYGDDWQLRAAARVMALLFAANITGAIPRNDAKPPRPTNITTGFELLPRGGSQRHRQIIPLSDFYNMLLDYSDLTTDFEAWEARRGKFTFCQYPFFLSIWAKIQIMEYDTHRQMEVKAREAFFDSIMTRKTVNQYLILRVRRECLVEDSLKGVSEVVGTGQGDIKKGLRIEFKGEEGIDAGGLRKEWFLLLVREVFNPEHGV